MSSRQLYEAEFNIYMRFLDERCLEPVNITGMFLMFLSLYKNNFDFLQSCPIKITEDL